LPVGKTQGEIKCQFVRVVVANTTKTSAVNPIRWEIHLALVKYASALIALTINNRKRYYLD